MWTLAFGHHEDRTPTHGYEPTREAAMPGFSSASSRSNARAEKQSWPPGNFLHQRLRCGSS
jgi:hypothetical protein